jgi:hypothetical protein
VNAKNFAPSPMMSVKNVLKVSGAITIVRCIFHTGVILTRLQQREEEIPQQSKQPCPQKKQYRQQFSPQEKQLQQQ